MSKCEERPRGVGGRRLITGSELMKPYAVGFGLAVESDLSESGLRKPGPDLGPAVGIGSTARPDHEASGRQKRRGDVYEAPHIVRVDVPEDSAQHEDVNRKRIGENLQT
jgi:hypothetical protein